MTDNKTEPKTPQAVKKTQKSQIERMNLDQLEKMLSWVSDSPHYVDLATQIRAEIAVKKQKQAKRQAEKLDVQ